MFAIKNINQEQSTFFTLCLLLKSQVYLECINHPRTLLRIFFE